MNEWMNGIDNGGDLMLELGLLIPRQASQRTTIVPENDTYQPIHKTFLEYLAAFYLSKLDGDGFVDHFVRFQSQWQLGQDSLQLILKFTAGLLASNAHIMFRCLWTFDLPVMVFDSFSMLILFYTSGLELNSVLSNNNEVLIQKTVKRKNPSGQRDKQTGKQIYTL